jgi:hypothetical protein
LIFDQDKSSNTDYEKIFIGLFVMFYSLIQFFELMMYLDKSNSIDQIYKKLLILNLGFQGLFFFIMMSLIYKVNSIYLVICGLVSFITILNVFIEDENVLDINFSESKCLKWNFISLAPGVNTSFGLMYFSIFLWIFIGPNSNYMKYVGFVLLGTLVFSYFILSNKVNSPSFWCLSSAIAAPLFLLY